MTTATVPAGLSDAAHASVNDLFDVVALLRAALEGLAAADGGKPDEVAEASGHARRIVRIAEERVQKTIEVLTPHV